MKKTLAILFALVTSLTYSQHFDNRLDGLDQEINDLIKSYNAVGLSIAVVKDDKLIYSKGFGYRDLENQLPVTDNTVFPIGSITKSFTGTLLGILADQGQVSLQHKPSIYIPDFRFYNDEMDNLIAIEDLLSHKSGIGNTGTLQVFFPDNDKLRTVQQLRYLKPEAEIKNSFAYSNMGYTLAGVIVEQITKKSWDANIQESIFNPLNMAHSFTSFDAMQASNNYSYGYGLSEGKIEKVNFEKLNSISPAGAIKSTALDMSKWMMTWMNKGIYNSKQVIPKDYVHDATILQNISSSDYEKDAFLFGDGFGWRLRSSYGRFRVEHGGNNTGFSAELMMFPFEKIGIVVLTNQSESLLPYMVADNIVKRMFDLEAEPEYPVVVTDLYKPSPDENSIYNDQKPTHLLNAFCGAYEAKGFGEIEIVLEKDKLYAMFPTYKFGLAHLNYNTFYLKALKDFNDGFNPGFKVQFIEDTEGDISQLKLYSQNEPVEFDKK